MTIQSLFTKVQKNLLLSGVLYMEYFGRLHMFIYETVDLVVARNVQSFQKIMILKA